MKTPLFVISREKVLEQYKALKELGISVAYSKKSNRDVWKILEAETDSQVIVHCTEKLDDIEDKSRAWYFTLAVDDGTLDKLFGLGFSKFVVDNPEDLQSLIKYAEDNGEEIDLLLRMKMKENTIFTGKYFVFGMYAKTVHEKIRELKGHECIKRIGVHFHRKTQNVSEWSLQREISEALPEDVLAQIDILDIGGGIPSKYKSSHDRALGRVFEEIKKLRKWLPGHIELIAEPGRFIAAPAVKLKTKILAVHDDNVFVDFSMYAGAVDTVLANVKLIVEGELSKGRNYTVKGPTPCSMDILRYRVHLDDPKPGDVLMFLNAGAYPYATNFCDLEEVEVEVR